MICPSLINDNSIMYQMTNCTNNTSTVHRRQQRGEGRIEGCIPSNILIGRMLCVVSPTKCFVDFESSCVSNQCQSVQSYMSFLPSVIAMLSIFAKLCTFTQTCFYADFEIRFSSSFCCMCALLHFAFWLHFT